MYAIIKTGGKQYKVTPGEYLDVERLNGEVGDKVDVEVLLINDGKKIITDEKELAAAKVDAEIVDHHKGDKVIVFKFKKRKGYKRTRGHRQLLTRIVITSINGVVGEKKAATKKAATKKPAAKKETAKKEVAPKKEAAAPKKAQAKEEKPAAAKSDDYSKMTVAQLKELAAGKGIKIPSGSRKADIIELIQNA